METAKVTVKNEYSLVETFDMLTPDGGDVIKWLEVGM